MRRLDGRLLLVRHGESTWNTEHRWAGQADPPLTDRGRSQARELAGSLTDIDFDRVVSSDLCRATETANLIADALGAPSPIEDVRLRERSAVWSGLTSAEIEVSFPGQLDAWRSGELRDLPSGSETWDDFLARVGHGIEHNMSCSQSALAVAHAGVFRAVEELFNVPFRRIGNADGQWLYREHHVVRPGPQL